MFVDMSGAGDQVRPKVLKAKDFANRLVEAVGMNSHAPSGHGRQIWLLQQLQAKRGVTVTPEGVRKWFAGEARPRPETMSEIAAVLNVDEAWLALGITPEETPVDVRRRNAMAEGMVNVFAGLLQLAGGHIAFGDANSSVDIHAIVDGQKVDIEVKLCRKVLDGEWHLAVSREAPDHTTVAAFVSDDSAFPTFVLLPRDAIISAGEQRGGYTELKFSNAGSKFRLGNMLLTPMHAFTNLT